MKFVCMGFIEETKYEALSEVEGQPDCHVQWLLESGPAEWIGTEVTFGLKQEGEYSIVNFSHSKWREAVEFTAHCSMKWATFLLSLKQFLEHGSGLPSPNDVKIDNWN